MRPAPTEPGRRRQDQGFTLVEMIIAMTLMSILAAVAVPMLQMPMTAYMESSARARATTDLDWVQSKLSTDFASALPNSVRVKTLGGRYFIEFLQVHAQGRYRAGASGVGQTCPATPACGGAPLRDALEFGASPACTDSCFFTLGALDLTNVVPGSDLVVVHPGSTPGVNGDPYANDALPALQAIKSRLLTATPNAAQFGTQITMTPHAFPVINAAAGESPLVNRFYVIGSSPVTYACNTVPGVLTRYWGYAINPVQPTAFAAAVPSATLSSSVTCSIAATTAVVESAGIRGRGGLVTIKMRLSVPVTNGSVPEQTELVFTAPVNDG